MPRLKDFYRLVKNRTDFVIYLTKLPYQIEKFFEENMNIYYK